jgi:pimeloyl-ACP methyl ester carboxylesterase
MKKMIATSVEQKAIETITTTPDGVSIAATWRPGRDPALKRLLVIAPGYAQNQTTRSMRVLLDHLSVLADTLIVDFRGTGKSGGQYHFGAREDQDLLTALAGYRKSYAQIAVLGFSLGAYISLRAQLADPFAQRLFLVSAFSWPGEILLAGRPLIYAFRSIFQRTRFRFPPGNQPFFKWGPLFEDRPKLSAPLSIQGRCHLLAGAQDALVPQRFSRRLYENILGPKTWTLWEKGVHAEQMFLQEPERFLDWILQHWS